MTRVADDVRVVPYRSRERIRPYTPKRRGQKRARCCGGMIVPKLLRRAAHADGREVTGSMLVACPYGEYAYQFFCRKCRRWRCWCSGAAEDNDRHGKNGQWCDLCVAKCRCAQCLRERASAGKDA